MPTGTTRVQHTGRGTMGTVTTGGNQTVLLTLQPGSPAPGDGPTGPEKLLHKSLHRGFTSASLMISELESHQDVLPWGRDKLTVMLLDNGTSSSIAAVSCQARNRLGGTEVHVTQ